MEGSNSIGLGFMAAFAVSGSVALIARQVHKRLLSDFMKEMEYELGGPKRCQEKKRVRFADNLMEPNNDQCRGRHSIRLTKCDQEKKNSNMNHGDGATLMEAMPLNWQILYKGIIEYKTLKGYGIN